MNKKQLIFILILLVAILLFVTLKVAVKDKGTDCFLSGGTFRMFSNGCGDSCAFVRQTLDNPIVCAQAFTESCDCGPLMCWNDKLGICELN